MIKSLICLTFVTTLASCSFSENKDKEVSYHTIATVYINKSELHLDRNKGVWYYQNIPFNGYARQYYKNDVIAEQVGYYNGKKEGLAKKWYANGVVKREYYYTQNSIHGISKSYWPNKQLAKEVLFENSKKQGIETSWHKNGVVAKKRNIIDDKENGLQKAWLENGKLYVNYEAKNGRIFGMKKAIPCYSLEDEKVIRYDQVKK